MTFVKQRRPHDVAHFLKEFNVEDRHEVTNLLLQIGLQSFRLEQKKMRECARCIAPTTNLPSSMIKDGDVDTIKLLRHAVQVSKSNEAVHTIRSGSAGRPRGTSRSPSPATHSGRSPQRRDLRSPRCAKCFLDRLEGGDGSSEVAPIKELIKRDKQEYYNRLHHRSELSQKQHSGGGASFQLVERSSSLQGGGDASDSGNVQELQATQNDDSGSHTATMAATVSSSSQGAVTDTAATTTTAAAAAAATTSSVPSFQHWALDLIVNSHSQSNVVASSPSEQQGHPRAEVAHHMQFPHHLDVSVSETCKSESNVDNNTNHNDSPTAAASRTAMATAAQLLPLPTATAHSSPLPVSNGELSSPSVVPPPPPLPVLPHLDSLTVFPSAAVKPLWEFICKEHGARRNPLIVAAALPEDLSVITLSSEFQEVYQSLLLAYHLKQQHRLM